LKIQDDTFVFELVNGQLKPRRVTEFSEIAELTAKICPQKSTNLLCRLPAYMTVTSGQSEALAEMFPKAPKTSRELSEFKTIKPTMSMSEVVSMLGKPDEVGGSGINIFIYLLDDGSLVAIGSVGDTSPLLYANHISGSGNSTPLFSSQN